MTDESVRRRLVGVFGVETVSGVIRLSVPILMGRAIGAHAYGSYAVTTSWTVLVFNVAASGIPLAGIVYSAQNPGRATSMRLLLWAATLTSAAAICAIPLGLFYRDTALSNISPLVALYAIASAVPYSIEYTALGVLRGQGQATKASWYGLLRQLSLVATALILQATSGTASDAVCAFAIGTLVLAVSSSLSALRRRPRTSIHPPTLREVARFAAHVQVSTFLTFLNYRLSLLLLAAFAPGPSAGIYAATLGIAEGIWFFSHVVAGVLTGDLASRIDAVERWHLTARACRLVTAASVAAALMVSLLSKPIMGALGPEFTAGWDTLVLLLIAAAVLAPSRILASYQAAVGSPQSNIPGTLAGVLVNLAATSMLVPYIGVNGAGIAGIVAYAVIASDRVRRFMVSAPTLEANLTTVLVPTFEDVRTLIRRGSIKSNRVAAVSSDER